ncbi:MAG TPA: pseudouridine synthase [Bacteroidales bacterium]|nr:pseudouridine synthase [Bacteroidales bacterium]
MTDIKKNVGVKRETRTNSESEPSKVYQPRTLKARPVSTKETDENDTTPIDSEKFKGKHSDDSTNETKSFKKSNDSAEVKSTYKPRTGTFKVSDDDFSAHIVRSEETPVVIKKKEPTERKRLDKPSSERNSDSTEKRIRIEKPSFERKRESSDRDFSRERKSDDKPFEKRESRFGSKREEPRRTSRSIAGKSTGYISSRTTKEKDDRRFDDLTRRDRTRDRKPYATDSVKKTEKLRLVLPTTGEKKYLDKPIPKPKREYDDKPFLEVDNDGLIRLNKYIANTGLCSRREADEFIQTGMITVNGEVITQVGTKVDPNSEVCFKGRKLEAEHKVYILLNKPKDYITTVEDPNAKRTVMELIEGACTERVYPVGRLDRNSTGLLLLTNDGEMTKRLTHPSHMKKKIYHVGLDKPLTREDMEKMIAGVDLEGELVKADAVEYIEETDGSEVGVEIHTGQNRVVRNMFDSLGYKVSRLDRVYFAGLTKKNLPRGKWRFLTQTEINMLKMNRFE